MGTFLCALFSIDSGAITQAQRDAIANLTMSWVLLNTRNLRFYIEICGPKNQLIALRDYLISIGRNPIVIAVFDPDVDVNGNAIQQYRVAQGFNQAEYLNVAPDVSPGVRPATFVQTHMFAGWGNKAGVPF